MIRKTLPAILALSAILGTACSTAQVRMMPGENGANRVVVRDVERDSAEAEAIDAANEYCEKQKKKAIFTTKDKTKYTGGMSEGTRDAIRKGSTAAMALGGLGLFVPEARMAGGVLGTAGMAGRAATSDRDYQSEIEFKCE